MITLLCDGEIIPRMVTGSNQSIDESAYKSDTIDLSDGQLDSAKCIFLFA